MLFIGITYKLKDLRIYFFIHCYQHNIFLLFYNVCDQQKQNVTHL